MLFFVGFLLKKLPTHTKSFLLAGYVFNFTIHLFDAVMVWLATGALFDERYQTAFRLFAPVLMLHTVLNYLEAAAGQAVGRQAIPDLLQAMHRHFLALDVDFHQNHSGADKVDRVNEVTAVFDRLDEAIRSVAAITTAAMVMLVLVGLQNILFALGFATFLLVGGMLVRYAVFQRQDLVAARAKEERAVKNRLTEDLTNAIHLIRDGDVKTAVDHFSELVSEYKKTVFSHGKKIATIWTLVTALFNGVLFLTVLLAVFLLRGKSAELWQMVIVVMYLLRAGRVLTNLHNILHTLIRAVETIRTLSPVLKAMPTTVPPPQPMTIKPSKKGASVSFREVNHSFGPKRVLRDVSFQLAPGTIAALVGSSGGGKTTIGNLLLWTPPPDAGVICVDGQDVAGLDLQQHRQRVAFVPQNPPEFKGTVRSVVRGLRNASDEDIWEALYTACLDKEVRELEDGLDTDVTHLSSAGQRQRLCVARALLRDASLAIFDEVGGNLDESTRRELMRRVTARLREQDMTALCITHNRELLAFVDAVFELADGRVHQWAGEAR